MRNLFPPPLPSYPMSHEDYADLYHNLLLECHNLRFEKKLLENKIREQNNEQQNEWSNDEIAKAFVLLHCSKRAYMYVKDELHYRLPGKNIYFFFFHSLLIHCSIFSRTFILSIVG